MDRFQSFQATDCPLEGINLVEASAGTGKTYAITGLFLRLLVEKKLSVGEILVVTFTEAATAELKERIRNRLREALRRFEGDGNGEDDPLYQALLRKIADRRVVRHRLRQALRNFDESAIFTIHGFCARVLGDHPFESGSPLEVEVSADERLLSREVICDYWRRRLQGMSLLFADYLVEEKIRPETLQELVEPMLRTPGAVIVPDPFEEPVCDREESSFRRLFVELSDRWEQGRSELVDILLRSPALNRRKYSKKKMTGLISQFDVYCRGERERFGVPDAMAMLAPENLAAGVKRGFEPPQHPFFECCGELLAVRDQLARLYRKRLLAFRIDLFDFVRRRLRERKEEARVRFFSDLLLDVKAALEGQQRQAFLQAVRHRYQAALIDEFQDTDPVQYQIFEQLFGDGHGVLYLIGDPKQAIYGFRGADIFAYFHASRQARQRFTLEHNWRSEPGLIEACNRIFGRSSVPFVYREIQFRPAQAAERPRHRLRFDEACRESLQLWFVDAGAFGKDKPLNKQEAQAAVLRALTAEIARLVDDGHRGAARIGERALREQDIAVLVRTGREAQAVHEQLRRRGIPGIIYQSGNLFQSREAEEVEYFLRAVLENGDEGLVRTCLSTGLYGLNARQLDELREGSGTWEACLDGFRTYRELWLNRGFMIMFREWLKREKVLKRLMGYPDGERRVTNLLHLAELLNQRSLASHAGPLRLVKWLADTRARPDPDREEHLLRLETDEAAVRIVTIHKSKGLEYPVVFCPFNWNHFLAPNKDDPFVVCHRSGKIAELLIDVGSEKLEEHRLLSRKEHLAEDLRLLYVALTRARHRCYLVTGEISGAPWSAPAYLLHDLGGRHDSETGNQELIDPDSPAQLFSQLTTNYNNLSTEQRWEQLRALAKRSNGTIALDLLPQGAAEVPAKQGGETESLIRPAFAGRVRSGWKIASFSSLTVHSDRDFEQPDRDPEALGGEPRDQRPAADTVPERSMFSFPRGAEAGIVLHDILEQVDFTTAMTQASTRDLVRDNLGRRGFDLAWTDTVCAMLREVVRVGLPGRSPVRLANVGWGDRLSELEFHFPLQLDSPAKLADLVGRHCGRLCGEAPAEPGYGLDTTPLRGFMKGFIDLVFRAGGKYYLVDWKSNYLGAVLDDYHKSRLARTMVEEQYVLQYLIYTVAVHEYLSLRWPGYRYREHFGGVFYLFLRGVKEAAGGDYGIFFDHPPLALVEQFRRLLRGGSEPRKAAP